jgi:hypothetical protein
VSAPAESRRVARLDGRQRSKAAVLARLCRELGAPAPARNLDALYDVLRRDVAAPSRSPGAPGRRRGPRWATTTAASAPCWSRWPRSATTSA